MKKHFFINQLWAIEDEKLVETASHIDFSAARAFYTKQGFINEAIIRNYYDVGEDKLIFTKNMQS